VPQTVYCVMAVALSQSMLQSLFVCIICIKWCFTILPEYLHSARYVYIGCIHVRIGACFLLYYSLLRCVLCNACRWFVSVESLDCNNYSRTVLVDCLLWVPNCSQYSSVYHVTTCIISQHRTDYKIGSICLLVWTKCCCFIWGKKLKTNSLNIRFWWNLLLFYLHSAFSIVHFQLDVLNSAVMRTMDQLSWLIAQMMCLNGCYMHTDENAVTCIFF